MEALIEHDLARDDAANALVHAEALAAGFPRRPSAWFWRAAALQANQRGLEAARALSSLAQRTPSDDPVGMGARLGLAASVCRSRARRASLCHAEKIFSRPQAGTLARCRQAFPPLKDWQKTIDRFLPLTRPLLMAEMAHAGKQHGETGVIGGGNDFLIAY